MNRKQTAPIPHVDLRFYEELNEFLPQNRRRRSFEYPLLGTVNVHQLITELGVPHQVVDLVLVNDEPVSFSHPLSGGDRVAVFPVFERLDIAPLNRLRSRPLRRTRFVADKPLEKLAHLLRLAGFDTVHNPDATLIEMVSISSEEKRVILSLDPELLRHARVTHGYWVKETNPPAQFREIVDSFDLRRSLRPFSRCMECNGDLRVAEDSEVMDQIPFAVLVAFDDFWQCEQCRRIYWKGSHYERLAQLIE